MFMHGLVYDLAHKNCLLMLVVSLSNEGCQQQLGACDQMCHIDLW